LLVLLFVIRYNAKELPVLKVPDKALTINPKRSSS
jgi:hypothetical protein